MKFILDENMSRSWRAYLRTNGVEAYDWEELGRKSEQDKVIVEYARKNGYVVITQDSDYGTILKSDNASNPSVIYLRVELSTPAAVGRQLLDLIRNNKDRLESGVLIIIKDSGIRYRDLPLPPPANGQST